MIEKEIDGERCEPFETVDVDLPEEYSGAAISLLNERKGTMTEMGSVSSEGMVTIQYDMPARGMAGVKSKMLSATRGLAAAMNAITVKDERDGAEFERWPVASMVAQPHERVKHRVGGDPMGEAVTVSSITACCPCCRVSATKSPTTAHA